MTTIRSVAAQRASLSTRVANTWELLLVDDTYADSDTFEDLTDVTAYEVAGGGYARDTLTGISWDTTGDVPAVKVDDADVPGTGPDATGAWIVDTDDDKLLFFVDFESTITLSGSLPIEWAGGSIALYDDTSADIDAIDVRVGTLESNTDTTGSTAGHVWTVVTPGSPAEFQAPTGGVASVTPGLGVTNSGTSTNPILNVPSLPDLFAGAAATSFVYNSGGTQLGNRFNTWTDLVDRLAVIQGPKTVQFEQAETIPAGAWDLNGSTLLGTGNFGGLVVTFADGCTLTGLGTLSAALGITLYSESTDPIVTVAASQSFYFQDDALVASKSAPFFDVTATTGLVLFSLRTGSGFARPSDLGIGGGDYESVQVPAEAGSTLTVIVAETYGSTIMRDDTIRGPGTVVHAVYTPVTLRAFGQPITGDVQTNLTGWSTVYGSDADRMLYVPATPADWTGAPASLPVAAALDELAARVVVLEP